jgi:hypothetical protein
MSLNTVPSYTAASTQTRLDALTASRIGRRSGPRHGLATLLVNATLALALASFAMTIGAAVVVPPDRPNGDVTGAIVTPSGQTDEAGYIDEFAAGPGLGWFAPQPAPSAPNGRLNRRTDR